MPTRAYTMTRQSIFPASPAERSDFHPATDPEVIAADHAREVSVAIREFGQDDPKILSDITDLPLYNVRRALVALGLIEAAPPPDVKATRICRATTLTRLIEFMSKGGKFSTRELARALETGESHVSTTIRNYGSHFNRYAIAPPLRVSGEPWVKFELKMEHRTALHKNQVADPSCTKTGSVCTKT